MFKYILGILLGFALGLCISASYYLKELNTKRIKLIALNNNLDFLRRKIDSLNEQIDLLSRSKVKSFAKKRKKDNRDELDKIIDEVVGE